MTDITDITSIGSEVLVTYAYDGSGVALRARATVTGYDDRTATATVILDGSNREAISCLGGIEANTPASDLQARGTYPRVASFGWLD